VAYGALVPNVRGYGRSREAGLGDIAVFLSASETHNRKNIGCSIDEAFARYRDVCALAERDGVRVRGYVSTAFGCPYEGAVPQDRVVSIARDLAALGCYEISLGDTIGVGYPAQVARTVEALASHLGVDRIALHFHDTYGRALANALAGLDAGVTTFDSSIGGLGGCPYAPGATGNAATDELVAMLEGMGVATGVDLARLRAAALEAGRAVGHEPPSRYLKAALATEARAVHE
jgi:hydroxymethylglutaryl-CoA lyase